MGGVDASIELVIIESPYPLTDRSTGIRRCLESRVPARHADGGAAGVHPISLVGAAAAQSHRFRLRLALTFHPGVVTVSVPYHIGAMYDRSSEPSRRQRRDDHPRTTAHVRLGAVVDRRGWNSQPRRARSTANRLGYFVVPDPPLVRRGLRVAPR